MPIVKVIQNCIQAAQEDFDKMCPEEVPKKEFSNLNAFARCTELAYDYYMRFDLKTSRTPYFFELMEDSDNLGRYKKIKGDKKDWCGQWVPQPEAMPDNSYGEEEGFGFDSITADKVVLDNDGLTWGQWALIGGVALGVGAATVLSGGSASAPAAVGGATLLQAVGVGAAAGFLTYIGIGDDGNSVPNT